MSIPRGFIDFAAVKAAVPLEKVLIHYGVLETLQPHGAGLRGRCPIHKGSSPRQFAVTLEKNLWNCFSECQGGGGMLEFVIRMEQCTAREAAWKVNDWFGLGHGNKGGPRAGAPKERAKSRPPAEQATAPQPASEPGQPPDSGDAVIASAKEAEAEETGENPVLTFSLDHLDASHPYLTGRGLTPETIAHFGIGHCPKGIMAGRIAIPIHNAEGQIVANAGRWPGKPPEGKEKYRLPGRFKKTLELFNLHRAAAQSADPPLVIVEGFFSVMRLWQHGVRRVVALMGSHLSVRQEELIAGIVTGQSRIVLMLDNDEAGIAAGEKMIPRLAGHCFVKAFRWPDGFSQPDELAGEQLAELRV